MKRLICRLWGHGPLRWREYEGPEHLAVHRMAAMYREHGAASLDMPGVRDSWWIKTWRNEVSCVRCAAIVDDLSEGAESEIHRLLQWRHVAAPKDIGTEVVVWGMTFGPLRRALEAWSCMFFGHQCEWQRDPAARESVAACVRCGTAFERIDDRRRRREGIVLQ